MQVMVLTHDMEKGRLSLSTRKLEPTPGDMLKDPRKVFEKAEEMAEEFKYASYTSIAMKTSDCAMTLSWPSNDNQCSDFFCELNHISSAPWDISQSAVPEGLAA